MAKSHSPMHFNGEADNFYDPNFTLDINTRMRVPKSIRVSGDYTDENAGVTNGPVWNQIPAAEKLDMHVPDRILVVGKISLNTYHICTLRKFTLNFSSYNSLV